MSSAPSANKGLTAALAELRDPQKLRVVTLVACAIVLGGVYMVSRDELVSLRGQLKKEQERARLLNEVESLKAVESQVNARFPVRNTTRFWTERLVGLVREVGVSLLSMEPRPLEKVRWGRLQGTEVQMTVEGAYRDVYRLVNRIEEAKPPARISRLSLRRGERGVTAEMELALLTEAP